MAASRTLGIGDGDAGIAFVVRAVTLDFLKPARMDDVVDLVPGRLS